MTTSQKGIDLIKSFESCRLHSYLDSVKIPTIGWGQTFYPDGSHVKSGDIISQSQADEMFLIILKKFERKVNDRITRQLKQNEFDAAVSFCYNAGTGYHDSRGRYHEYLIWEHINNQTPGMKEYWETLATSAGGITLNGLVRRRKAEAEMYLKS